MSKYWYEKGFILALYSKQQQEDHSNCIKAFIYGIGYGLFQKCIDEDNGHDTWLIKINGNSQNPIQKCDCDIDNSYYSLLGALPFNELMVKRVLAHVQLSIGQFSDCTEINDVLGSPLISGLCGVNNTSANIFDVFLSIFAFMSEDEWGEMFRTLLDLL